MPHLYVCVCADVKVSGHVSRRHAEHSTRPEVNRGCVLLGSSKRTHARTAASNLLRYL